MSFFYDYFIKPILTLSGYNVVNTFTYIAFYIIVFYVFYEYFLRKGRIKLDEFFFYNLMLSTYIILTARVCVDLYLCSKTYILYTPILEFWILLVFLPTILMFDKRRILFYFYIGSAIMFTLIFLKRIPNLLIILPITLILTIVYFVRKRKYWVLPFISQALDGISGTIGVMFGFKPEHVIHNSIIGLFGVIKGSLIFLSLKFLILVIFIYVVNSYIKEKDLRDTLYLAVFYLGYLTGLRNSLIISYYEI